MELRGYINYDKNSYTFIYENEFLSLVRTKPNASIFSSYKYVDFFEGFTIENFSVAFYVDCYLQEKCGTIKCFPKIVIKWLNNTVDEKEFLNKCKSITFSGGIINKFYYNKKILSTSLLEYFDNRVIKFNDPNETKCEEKIKLNNRAAIFQLSVSIPEFLDNGNIEFNKINSILRIGYTKEQSYKKIIFDIVSIINFFHFCSNRRNTYFDNIFLESYDKNSNKYEKKAEIYIPTKCKNEIKTMLHYEDIKGNVNKLFELLEEVKYSTHIVPLNDYDYAHFTPESYITMFSAFQSIYNFVNKNENIVCDVEKTFQKDFLEVKKEIEEFLLELDKKYKGISGKKRKYIKSYLDIVRKSNLKLELMIYNTYKNNSFILDSIKFFYKELLEKKQMSEIISIAVLKRDSITHDDIVVFDDESKLTYVILQRLIYTLILNKIGLKKKSVEPVVNRLSLNNII